MNIKEFAAQAVDRAFPGQGLVTARDAWVFLGGRRSTVSQLIFYGTFPLPRVALGGQGKGIRWYVPAPALADEYAKKIEESGWVPEGAELQGAGERTGGKARGRPGRHRKVCGEEVGHGD